MNNGRKHIDITVIIILASVLLIITCYSVFEVKLEQNLNIQTKEYLSDVTSGSIERINLKIQDTFSMMEALSLFIAQYDDIQSDDVMQLLKAHTEGNLYIRMGICNPQGICVSEDGSIYDVKDREDFKTALGGERSVSNVLISKVDQVESIMFSVPIKRDNQVIGVLRVTFHVDDFTKLVGSTTFEKKGSTFIAQADGTLVTRPAAVEENSNLFDILNSINPGDKTLKKLSSDIANRREGTITYNKDENKRFICYSPISTNNWYAVSIVSASVIDPQAKYISSLGIILSLQIMLCFTVFLVYLLVIGHQNHKKIRISEQRYRIVEMQSDSILFEYNCVDDTAYHSVKWFDKFGYEPPINHFVESMKNFIDERDAAVYQKSIAELEKCDFVEHELRILDQHKNPIWCTIRASAIRNRKGVLEKVIGKIIDIDKQKREMEYFKEMAKLDSLTGLYNKEASNYKIEHRLSTRGVGNLCALLYIDIDDFKLINDTYGHVFGDSVIKRVSECIKKLLVEERFAGRVGGEEFIIFIKELRSIEDAEEVALSLCGMINDIKMPKVEGFQLSVSVGIAICPMHGTTFHEILEHADKALYKAKRKGKNCYMFYDMP